MGSLPSKRGYSSIEATMSNTPIQPVGMDKCVYVALYNFPAGDQGDRSIHLGEQLNILSDDYIGVGGMCSNFVPLYVVVRTAGARLAGNAWSPSRDGDWWKVKSVSSGKECYMPRNYVAKVYSRWLYKGINREKAEELLLVSCNKSGSFLIRESETRRGSPHTCQTLCGVSCGNDALKTLVTGNHIAQCSYTGCYSLSVRQSNQTTLDSIKHYRINQLENGWYYISPRLTFSTLQDMVDYYSEMADGICCLLKEPCVAQITPPAALTSEHVTVKKPTLNWRDLDSAALFTEDANLEEDCPVSLGLREAVSSYMFMTGEMDSVTALDREHLWKA